MHGLGELLDEFAEHGQCLGGGHVQLSGHSVHTLVLQSHSQQNCGLDARERHFYLVGEVESG